MTSENFPENRGEAIKEYSTETDGIKLHYILHRQTMPSDGRDSYSIAVTVICGGTAESAYARDITSLRRYAEEIFDAVCLGTVTPCTLYDILEDML